MKKFALVLLAMLLVFSATACDGFLNFGKDQEIITTTVAPTTDIPVEDVVDATKEAIELCAVCNENEATSWCMMCEDETPVCDNCYCPTCFETCTECGEVFDKADPGFCQSCSGCVSCGNFAENGIACEDCGTPCLECSNLLFSESVPLYYCDNCDHAMCMEHDLLVEGNNIYCEKCQMSHSALIFTCSNADCPTGSGAALEGIPCVDCLDAEDKMLCSFCFKVVDKGATCSECGQ